MEILKPCNTAPSLLLAFSKAATHVSTLSFQNLTNPTPHRQNIETFAPTLLILKLATQRYNNSCYNCDSWL